MDDEGDLEEKEFIKTDGKDNVLERILYDEDEKIKERGVNRYIEKCKLFRDYMKDSKFSAQFCRTLS